jgi:hypothetical protein
MNKKSVYRQIQFVEKDSTPNAKPMLNVGMDSGGVESQNKILAEKIVSQNLNDNIGEIQQELTSVSEQIKLVVENCEAKLNQVIKEIEIMGSL